MQQTPVCAQALRIIGRLTEGAKAQAVPLIGAVPATQAGAQGRGREKQGRTARSAARKGSARKTSPKRSRAGPAAAPVARASDVTETGTALRIPFGNKEAAQQLGALYRAGGWYAPPGVALDPFRQRGWL